MPVVVTIERVRAGTVTAVGEPLGPGGLITLDFLYEDKKDQSVTAVYSFDETIESSVPDYAKPYLSKLMEMFISSRVGIPQRNVTIGWSEP